MRKLPARRLIGVRSERSGSLVEAVTYMVPRTGTPATTATRTNVRMLSRIERLRCFFSFARLPTLKTKCADHSSKRIFDRRSNVRHERSGEPRQRKVVCKRRQSSDCPLMAQLSPLTADLCPQVKFN